MHHVCSMPHIGFLRKQDSISMVYLMFVHIFLHISTVGCQTMQVKVTCSAYDHCNPYWPGGDWDYRWCNCYGVMYYTWGGPYGAECNPNRDRGVCLVRYHWQTYDGNYVYRTITCPSSCPAGQYVSDCACTSCPAGSYCTGSAAISGTCPAGKYSTAGLSQCISCPAGTYNTNTGLSACIPCPAGTYTDSTAASACISCPTGSDRA